MITSDERKRFWDVLKNAHDASEETGIRIASATPPIRTLCRFRTVNEGSLLQLQSNRLFFSSADYYDDPFDTYFYIDYKRFRHFVEMLRTYNEAGGQEAIKSLLLQMGTERVNPSLIDSIVRCLPATMPSLPYFEGKLSTLREELLRCCFSICFCDDPLNEVLWLKYADSHRGFVQIYEMHDPETNICGNKDACRYCSFATVQPGIYPVYYSDEHYDATTYVLGERALKVLAGVTNCPVPNLSDIISGMLAWEVERISLIKKRCHEHDGEWRMICPFRPKERPVIGMKPSAIALGLRMPEYERRLVVSAAKVAGISTVYEMYIDGQNCLGMRPITLQTSAHISVSRDE